MNTPKREKKRRHSVVFYCFISGNTNQCKRPERLFPFREETSREHSAVLAAVDSNARIRSRIASSGAG